MIWVTGDIHGDPSRLSSRSFDEQEFFEKQDENFVIILGDFGLVWNYEKESKTEKWWLDWLAAKPFYTLFISGNHENFDRLDKYPVSEWNGGKVHFIRPHVIHLMRGQVFNIQGKTFFTFGGAASHDIKDGILEMSDERIRYWNLLGKEYRVNHLTWWEREMASREEMDEGLHNLERVGNKVDFILTHCINTSTAALMSSGRYKPDSMTEYLEKIYGTVEWKKWLFGHYHDNRAMTNNQLLLYDQIIQRA